MREGDRANDAEPSVAFLGGALTSATIALVVFVFIGSRVGLADLLERAGVLPSAPVLEIPEELVAELASMHAVIDNADNPTGVRKHDTILVRPDPDFRYVLRPNVSVDGYQIRSTRPLNLDPPVVYVESGASMSKALRAYLDANARISFTYTTNADGFRRTFPEIQADRKILVVGDSGAFGIGVDDDETVASNLQKLVGDAFGVVNAGVGGYNGDDAFRVARALSDRERYSALVYVAHNNDFYEPRRMANPEKMRRILGEFETLRDRFPDGMVVALVEYLEYTHDDLLLRLGWEDPEQVASLHRLRNRFPVIARETGFRFVDFCDIVDDVRRRDGSMLAPWSLYVDHGHLSPRASRLLAERIHARLRAATRARTVAKGL